MTDSPAEPGPDAARPARYRAQHAQHRQPRTRLRLRRRWPRRLLIGVNIVVALSLLTAGSAVGYVEWRLGQLGRVHVHNIVPVGKGKQSKPLPHTSAPPPMTILIVGSDTRAGLDQPGDSAYGSASQVGPPHSDTIMLARVVPATHQIALLSIPRDLWVDIPGLGHQKINAAISVSPDLLIQVIHNVLGVDVNHYVDVDFDSFKDIADAVGGVEQYFPTPVEDKNAGLSIPAAGCYNLTGNLALAFVRSREYHYEVNGRWYQEGLSDLARIQRQQMFIRKLAKKAEHVGLTDLSTLNGIIGGLTKNLTVDQTFSVSLMLDLAKEFRSLDPSKIAGWTLPATPEVLPGPNDVLMPDSAADAAMVQQFLAFGQAPAPSSPSAHATLPGTSTTTTTVAPSSFQVVVDNGSGVPGQAGAARTALQAAGFRVASIATAASFDHPASLIEYGPGDLGAAQTLAGHVGGGATLQETSGLPAGTVELVTGRSFSGIAAGSGAGVVSSAPSTSATTVPPTTSTTYVLPGTPKDAPPPPC